MGQKTKGFRRGERYGRSSNRKGRGKGNRGWQFQINPVGIYGYYYNIPAKTNRNYGKYAQDGMMLTNAVEQLLYSKGCTTNGIGVTGSRRHGYTVHGEYRRSNTNLHDLNASLARVEVIAEELRETKVNRTRTSVEDLRQLATTTTATTATTVMSPLSRPLEDRYQRRSKSFRIRGPESRVSSIDLWKAVVRSGIIPSSTLLAKRVARQLEDTIQHRKVIRELEAIIITHAYDSPHGLKTSSQPLKDGYWGYKVTVKGVIGGSLRTTQSILQEGRIPESTKEARIATSHSVAKTSIGTRGVQVDYCYGIG